MASLRNYEVRARFDYEDRFTRTIMAMNGGKARYEFWSDLQDAGYDIPWAHVRSRALGLAYKISTPISEDVRRKLEIMRHALGLDHIGLNRQGEPEGYRNHYALFRTSDDFELLMSMCDPKKCHLMSYRAVDGLAEGMVYFHVNIHGADFVKRHTGVDHSEPRSTRSSLYVLPRAQRG